MGWFSNRMKQIKKINRKCFQPLELTEENVNAIFNQCVYEKGKLGEQISSNPFLEVYDYSLNNSDIILLKEEVIKNKANIMYLVGQIKGFASKKEITPSDIVMSYHNLAWTKDFRCALRLVTLCCNEVTNILYPFDYRLGQHSAMILKKIEPTLSPKDKIFPMWYEYYKDCHPEIDFGD